MSGVDAGKVAEFVGEEWDRTVTPALVEYVRIPNESPLFDPKWEENGHFDRAMKLFTDWIDAQAVPGLTYALHKDDGRTPFLCIEVEATERTDETVCIYAHMDKQPGLEGQWSEGLGPWTPVLRDGKLFGRGGADDGYGMFAAVLAVKALRLQGVPHARIVILVEGSEESGSCDLPHYLEKLKDVVGSPNVLVCLDSGAGTYDRLWLTTSLRGTVVGNLVVRGTHAGVHSGAASGVLVSTFRVARILLDRLEDSKTGRVLVDELQVEIPPRHLEYARSTGRTLGDGVYRDFPLIGGARPADGDPAELMLNKTWRPTVSYTGVGGIPPLVSGGNVLRPMTALKLSVRLPPSADAAKCAAAVKRVLESDPPYGYSVSFDVEKESTGWAAPESSPWLVDAVEQASKSYFGGKSAGYIGEGGSVPFVGALGRQFPGIQFVVTGVLGPKSNAHGPDESLDIPMAKGVTCSVASILAEHFKATSGPAAKRQKA